MGAGLSGLSCAIYLEKQGIAPFIFEKRSQIGDRFVNGEALFHMLAAQVNIWRSFCIEKFKVHKIAFSYVVIEDGIKIPLA